MWRDDIVDSVCYLSFSWVSFAGLLGQLGRDANAYSEEQLILHRRVKWFHYVSIYANPSRQ